jgi:predicted nuclease with TOPRIM domain
MSDSDLGQYIMKLFDPLISESKEQLGASRDEYVKSIPRKVPAHSSIPIYQAENFVRDNANQLIKISQDLLTQYSISIAKKTRAAVKKKAQAGEESTEDLKQQLTKKEAEIEGLQKKVTALEQRSTRLEAEKEETLKQFSRVNAAVIDLESNLSATKMKYEKEITDLTAEWEEKFRQNQDEWESYVKLKIAEQEVQSSKITPPEEE